MSVPVKALRAVITAGFVSALLGGRAEAQIPAAPAAASPIIEVGVGVIWGGGASMGTAQANLLTSSGSALTLFSTSSRLAAGTGADFRLTVPLTERLAVEGRGTWRRATLETTTSGDLENAAAQTLTQPTSQFSVEGGVTWSLARRGRFAPFLCGDAGWMRQLSSDGALARDGLVANLGGGVKYWWREDDRRHLKRLGVRIDLGALVRSGGIVLGGQKRSVALALSGAALFGF